MATYTASQLKISAPKGGFEELGWYPGADGGSYQYKGGTFGESGYIHPDSPQQGAGQKVSDEILASTSVAAGLSPTTNKSYLSKSPVLPALPGSGSSSSVSINSAGDVTSYLDSFQQSQYSNSLGDLKTELTGGLTAPETINRSQLLQEQRAKYSVDETEQQLNEIKTQERELQALMRAKTVNEEGKPVALGVISGRISEEARQTQQELDYLNVRKATLVDELNTKYNAINTFINYAGLDYQDAKAAYDTAFSQNLQLQQYISSERQNAVNNAQANLTTMMNAIASGNLSYNDISPDEKLQIQKLEVQAGLPVGTVSRLQISPKDKILGWSDDKTQVMVLNENGGFDVISSGLKKSSGSGSDFTDNFLKSIGMDPTTIDAEYVNPNNSVLDIEDIISTSVAPNYSPSAGIGSITTDSLGRTWQYESSGWRLIG